MRKDLYDIQDENVIVDPSDLECTDKEDVHGVFKDICFAINHLSVTATPGFTWGDSGVIKNAYLLNDSVPSNKSGRLVTITGQIVSIFIATESTTDEYTLQIRRRVGNTFTTIATISADDGDGLRIYNLSISVAVAEGDELAAYLKKSGNKGATNPVCGIIIQGS